MLGFSRSAAIGHARGRIEELCDNRAGNEARGGRGRRASVRPSAPAGIFPRAFSSTAELRSSTPVMRVRSPQGAPGRGPATRAVSKTAQRGATPRRPASEQYPVLRPGPPVPWCSRSARLFVEQEVGGRHPLAPLFLALSSKGRTRCSEHRDGGSTPPEAVSAALVYRSHVTLKP